MIRDLMICLSFANMLFARAWMRVLGPDHVYYMPHPDREAAFVGASVVVTTAAGFGLLRWMRKHCAPSLQSGTFAALLGLLIITVAVPSTSILRLISIVFVLAALALDRFSLPEIVGLIIVLAVPSAAALTIASIVFVLAAVALDRFSIPKIVGRLSLIALPCALVTFGQAFWLIAEPRIPHTRVEAAHRPVPINRGAPVVWIIFDELDQEVAFDRRPPMITLPALDDFKSHAWSASKAFPPSNHTEISIPALTTGKRVAETKPSGSREMMLRFAGSKVFVPWSKQETIFSQASSQGFTVSAVGWYLPYCDLFNWQLSSCFQHKSDLIFRPVVGRTLGASMLEELLETVPVVRLALKLEDDNKSERKFHEEDYETVHAALQTALSRFDSGVLYLHLPIPHPPGFYDVQKGVFTTDESANYFGNLILADRTLAEIKSNLQRSGMWDNSTVIVSSDHWWRVRLWSGGSQWTKGEEEFDGKTDHRVPFMVKMPHQTEPTVYAGAFNTVISSQIVLSALEGKIKSPEDLSAKVQQEAQDIEPVYRPYK